MILNLDESESFVNKIVSTYTDIPLTIKESEEIMMPQYKNSIIFISDYSLVLMLLESCSIINRKVFNKILYYYYWASKNMILGQIHNSYWCINALKKELYKKRNDLCGIANTIPYNLYFDFVIGHEAFHHCFATNDKYKKDVISEVLSMVNETYEDAFKDREWFKNAIKQPLKDFNPKNNRIIPAEECACDRESIKYIHKSFIETAKLNEQDYTSVLNHFLLMISMIQYEGIMCNLSRYKITPGDLIRGTALFKKYITEHIEKEIFRFACSAYTMQEISVYPYNPTTILNLVVKENHKMLSRLMKLGISNLAHSVNGETNLEKNEEMCSLLRNEMNEVNLYIFSVLGDVPSSGMF